MVGGDRMHELSVTRELVRQVLSVAPRPVEVHVELGLLTSYKPEPLKYYFDVLKRDNEQLADADLVIREVAGRIRCKTCHKESQVEPQYVFLCPVCSSLETDIIAGSDMILKKVVQ